MSHATKLDKFLMSYENATAWGNVDQDEAVHEAINVAYPELADGDKANLFAEIMEGFKQYDKTRMVKRRMWLGTLLNGWAMSRRGQYLRDIRAANTKEEVNAQQEAVVTGLSASEAAAKLVQERVNG